MTPFANGAVRLALAAMASTAAAAPASAELYANFRCADGSGFTLIFEKGGATGLVMIDGGALRLHNRRPASGIWFASPNGELRGKGGEASFWMTGRARTTCRQLGPVRDSRRR